MRVFFMLLAIGLGALCGGVLLTLLLLPLWGWLDTRIGIEALGHSGPAPWCYGLSIGALALLGIILLARAHRRA
ncbi:hypothetical protein HNE05_04370 [Aquipseudomonas campi]|uniref:Uncharacterized protein n=1 Tax=Aquipseudomonas campi TaxID=2731681 RepID=A0A6M8FZQ5_9GAMM|nr:hypothetical protein [Pseudomonas campi]QKE62625.1 hypothetical protein HNE05_04370 [Pseudomonas campi]